MMYETYVNGNGLMYLLGYHKTFDEWEVICISRATEKATCTGGFKSKEEAVKYMGIGVRKEMIY